MQQHSGSVLASGAASWSSRPPDLSRVHAQCAIALGHARQRCVNRSQAGCLFHMQGEFACLCPPVDVQQQEGLAHALKLDLHWIRKRGADHLGGVSCHSDGRRRVGRLPRQQGGRERVSAQRCGTRSMATARSPHHSMHAIDCYKSCQSHVWQPAEERVSVTVQHSRAGALLPQPPLSACRLQHLLCRPATAEMRQMADSFQEMQGLFCRLATRASQMADNFQQTQGAQAICGPNHSCAAMHVYPSPDRTHSQPRRPKARQASPTSTLCMQGCAASGLQVGAARHATAKMNRRQVQPVSHHIRLR